MAGCTIGLGAGGGSARGQNARDQIVFVHTALYWIALARRHELPRDFLTERDGESGALHIG